jgi:hypothetical protein
VTRVERLVPVGRLARLGRLAPLGRFVPLLLGIGALLLGTAAGRDAALLRTIVTPLPLVRVGLVGGAVMLGLWLLGQAVDRIGRAGRVGDPADGIDIAVMLRGIRLVFLALASFAAAGGWLLAEPLPLIVAAVIAGVDVVETSFLLLALAVRGHAPQRQDER